MWYNWNYWVISDKFIIYTWVYCLWWMKIPSRYILLHHISSISIFFALWKDVLNSVATIAYSAKLGPFCSGGSKKCTKGLYNSRRRFLLPSVQQLIMYPNTIARKAPRSVYKYCDNLNSINGSGGDSVAALKLIFNLQKCDV